MSRTQPANGALTSLESALAALLDGLAPVAPITVPVSQGLGRVAAGMPPLREALPRVGIAAADGWAFRALDLAGASAYSPVPLMASPAWVEAGEPMPEGSDCVVEAALVDCSGPMAQAFAEAIPGQGMRRPGEDMAAERPVAVAGHRLASADLLVARAAGVDELAVRSPRLRVIDVAAASGDTLTAQFIAESAKASGATVANIETVARDATSIAEALDGGACDLIILVGGTGAGRADATAAALGARGALIAHNIALQPGRTAAIGRLGHTPVIALPGMPDQAFAAFLTLVQPVLDRLSGRLARQDTILPLARKIASGVGIAEIVLLKQERSAWIPLAVGDLSLDSIRMADAWLLVPGEREGQAAGTPIGAYPLRDFT